VVDLNYSHEMFNIQQLIPFKPCQNHWGCDLLYHVPHHIISLLVIMIHTSRLSPCTLTLFENPCTFFTNTHHPLQCYHLSFSTKKDCIFPCNTVATKPWRGSPFTSLPHHHLVRVEMITYILVLIVSILL
jgi:hypothetical protein